MIKKQPVVKVRTHIIGPQFPDSFKPLLPRIAEIYHALFEVDDPFDLNYLLRYRGETIALALFYGARDELAGFAIAGVQTIRKGHKTYAIFSAGAYSDLKYDVGQHVARFALVQSLKYKITHPTHELSYLCEALSPAPYSLATRILPQCYPHPHLQMPNHVKSIIASASKQRNFIHAGDSGFVVKFSIKRAIKDQGKLRRSTKASSCEFYNYYLTLNPDFHTGSGLLIYMPLTFINLAHGIKNYVKAALT